MAKAYLIKQIDKVDNQDYEADQADYVYHYEYADKVEEQNEVDQEANVNQVY